MAGAEKDRMRRWTQHDFYQILRVPRSATAGEIKKGFRRIALSCHPDKVPEAERKEATQCFQLIGEAYEVLSNEILRRDYDRLRPRAGLSQPREVPKPQGGAQVNHAAARQQQAAAPWPPPRVRPSAATSQPAQSPQWGRPQARSETPRDFAEFVGSNSNMQRCESCDTKCPLIDLRRCPKCPKRICPLCKLCAACIPDDSDDEDFSVRAANAFRRYHEAQPRRPPDIVPPRQERREQRPEQHPQRNPMTSAPTGGGYPGSEQRFEERHGERFAAAAGASAGSRSSASSNPHERRDGEGHRDQRVPPVRPRPQPAWLRFHEADGSEVWRQEGSQPAPNDARCKSPLRTEAQEPAPPRPAASPDAEAPLDVRGILVAMGFEEADITAALRRCSSVDAAVEFIMSRGSAADGVVAGDTNAAPSAETTPRVGHGPEREQADGRALRRVMEVLGETLPDAVGRLGERLPDRGSVYGVIERIGEKLPDRNEVYGAVGVGGGALYNAVGRLGGHIQNLSSWQGGSSATVANARAGAATAPHPDEDRLGLQAPEPPAPALGSHEGGKSELIATLTLLGFTAEQAQAAARRCSSVAAAVDWITAQTQASA